MKCTGEFEIAKLDVRAGDTVVVRVEHPVSADVARRLEAYLRPSLPDGMRILVLDPTASIEILRPDAGAVIAS